MLEGVDMCADNALTQPCEGQCKERMSVFIPQRRSLVSSGLMALRGSADLSSKIAHNLKSF